MILLKRLFVVGLVVFWVGMLTGCSSLQKAAFQKPTANYVESNLTSLTLKGATLEVVLAVHNPNSYAINLGALDYDFAIKGARVVQGKQQETNSLKAGATSRVVLPLEVEFADLLQLVKNLNGLNKLDYSVAGGMTFIIPVVGDYRVSYAVQGHIPKPSLPELSLASVKQEKFSLTGASYKAIFEVKNPNIFDLEVKQLNYNLSLNQQKFTQGKVANQKLAAGETAKVELPIDVRFNPASLGALYKILSKGDNLDYQVDFTSEISSDLPALKPFGYKGDKSGKLNLAR